MLPSSVTVLSYGIFRILCKSIQLQLNQLNSTKLDRNVILKIIEINNSSPPWTRRNNYFQAWFLRLFEYPENLKKQFKFCCTHQCLYYYNMYMVTYPTFLTLFNKSKNPERKKSRKESRSFYGRSYFLISSI